MKLYLDDVRTPRYPDNGEDWAQWIVVRTVFNFVQLIKTGLVTEVSLDYVLESSDPRHTGLDAIQKLHSYYRRNPDKAPPRIIIHSAHARGKKAVQGVADDIDALAAPFRCAELDARVGQQVRTGRGLGCIESWVAESPDHPDVPQRLHHGGVFVVAFKNGEVKEVPGNYLEPADHLEPAPWQSCELK